MTDEEIRQEVEKQLAHAGIHEPAAAIAAFVSLSDSLLRQQNELSGESSTRIDKYLAIAGPPGFALLYRQISQVRLSNCQAPNSPPVGIPEQNPDRALDSPFAQYQLVCPIDGCQNAPHFKGIIHGQNIPPASTAGPGLIVECACAAGHHWQTIFTDSAARISISTFRLPDLPVDR